MLFRLSLIAISVLFFSPVICAEEDDPLYRLLTQNREYECLDMISNAQRLIPVYYDENKIDSIIMVIEYVENSCGNGLFSSLRILLDIKNGHFSAAWCDSPIIWQMLYIPRYSQDITRWPGPIQVWYKGNFSWNDPGRQKEVEEVYDLFIRGVARELISKTRAGSLEHAVCLYFEGHQEELLGRLCLNQYQGTCLQDDYAEYMKAIEYNLSSSGDYWALESGIWIPTKDNRILGNKFQIGIIRSIKFFRAGLDLRFGFRYGNVKNKFPVIYGNEFRMTNKTVSGIYVVGGPSFEFLRRGITEADCFG